MDNSEHARLARSCFVFMFCGFAMYFSCVFEVLAERRSRKVFYRSHNKSEITTLALPDVGFQFIEQIDYEIADYFVLVLEIVTILRFVVISNPILRLAIFRRWAFCFGVLFILRGFFISATLLPNPNNKCYLEYPDSVSVFKLALVALVKRINTCADIIISGHSVSVTLAALVWHQYSHVAALKIEALDNSKAGDMNFVAEESYKQTEFLSSGVICLSLEKAMIWLFAIVIYILIVSTRLHYTIDVLVGCVFAWLVWVVYHHSLLVVLLQRAETRARPINAVLYVIAWLEEGTPNILRSQPNDSYNDGTGNSRGWCFSIFYKACWSCFDTDLHNSKGKQC